MNIKKISVEFGAGIGLYFYFLKWWVPLPTKESFPSRTCIFYTLQPIACVQTGNKEKAFKALYITFVFASLQVWYCAPGDVPVLCKLSTCLAIFPRLMHE